VNDNRKIKFQTKLRNGLTFLCIGGIQGFLLFAPPAPALAAEYPYHGAFAFMSNGEGPINTKVLCSLSFVEQKSNGNWIGYAIDLQKFVKSKKIVFSQVANGKCAFDREAALETCTTLVDKGYPDGEGKTSYDVIVANDGNTISTTMFDNLQDAKNLIENSAVEQEDAVAETGAAEQKGYRVVFRRCPQGEEKLLKHAVSEFSQLSAEEIQKLRFPTDSYLDNSTVDALNKALSPPD
jgi:hypothetical protein